MSDIELALNTKTKGLLLKTGHGMVQSRSVSSTYPEIPILDNFADAVALILSNKM